MWHVWGTGGFWWGSLSERCRRKWEDNIKIDHKEFIYLTQDTDMWWAVMNR